MANGTVLANHRTDRDTLSRIETGKVMRIGQITTAGSRPSNLPAPDADRAPADESRALVALMPATAARQSCESHRKAAFLAHLIATKDQLPQTRERRRAEPAEAIAAYRAGAALTDQ